ncbi:chaperone protein dnaJ 1, mitochondrial isoform X7 [Canna indica]|uniref:Chaperone protein dnaJ 1, mitochondrial isoform X7 n=1 Tax=Canna indica TaxID=4628 RepID=A0AAQ3Q2E3_9LILI|nr:chaperone protein dnaJ 1, mitochondrial isoform X7 [Canna indica]
MAGICWSEDPGSVIIKKSYAIGWLPRHIELAKKYHPDANKNNPASKRKFQEIRDAYETLRYSEKRAQYDEVFEHERETHSSNIEVELNLSFAEAAKGCTKQVMEDGKVAQQGTYEELLKSGTACQCPSIFDDHVEFFR